MRYLHVVLVLLLLSAQTTRADRTSFDEAWKFQLGDPSGAEATEFDDSTWRSLDVPHDWSIEGEYEKSHPMGDRGGYLPAGIGWYRKTVPVPEAWQGKHVEVAFDGVFMNSTVWANGEKLGTRPYGWSSFSYDISEIADSSDAITFAVRVDNSKQPSARWYTGSGIYAHTWMDVKEKVHVPNDGIFIRTEGNTAKLDTEIRNTSGENQPVSVRVSIMDPDGNVVAENTSTLSLKPNTRQVSTAQMQVPSPKRWDLESPNLYRCEVEIRVDGTSTDIATSRFGFRDVQWKPGTGMWLNGRNVKLRGVCNHQDAGALGAAVPDKVLRFRIEQLKAMGCNAIRTAHNPQTPIFYEICDEVGMLVMDEIFDGWRKKADHDYGRYHFDQWWRRDLTDWVKRDRNHPSVVIYSVGNETRGPVAEDLVALCHQLDPTRPVTSGHSASQHMDVFGVNGSSEKKGFFDSLDNDRVFIGTENTHTWQVRGYYRTKTWYRDGYPSKQRPYETPDLTAEEVFTHDWIESDKRRNRKQIFNSSYDNAMVRLNSRRNIQQIRDIPNHAGSFRWTGYDYIGEAGYVHGGWPFRAFMGGAIDLANFEKDLYYLYQSQWTDDPMVHILPHWTHPKVEEGTEIPVWVYSTCPDVELFFNGKSLGRQMPGTQWDEMQCQWMVPWAAGELKAVGYQGDKIVAEETVRSAGPPARIALSVDGEPLATSGKDIVQVRVTTTDAKGEMYPYGENRTYFQVIGPGKVRALDNGSPVDVEKHYEAESRIAFYGLTRGYIESTGETGDIALLASCILGEKKQITSNEVHIDTQVLALRGEKPQLNTEIFYTTDQSDPTVQSTPYTGPFSVPLGSTVKALVTVDGKPFQVLEERFAMDEGFVWNNDASPIAAETPGSEQAEDAKLSGATVKSHGSGFHGKGYIDFGSDRDAYAEWYQENDGDAYDATLKIRYSGKAKNRPGRPIQVVVNGKVIDDRLFLPNTDGWGTHWKTVSVPVQLQRGANVIRLSTVEAGGMYIDEIALQ
ncbi:glycoside hydrolase family 2 TIM barrel-domain containing protein [Allorhodopirellula solitaria]|uniref:Beta-galactosidase n=1 Tax=Allorhodopirellula solitaria TaxID=2527987 RepID=A0A5C5YEV9_9BACT|nr:glycoside hydrolase family 2 TIM barrel-domain containing protein [Allorhodopirellula solitaria]TWT72855.1 Beta-galactosidase [Allorhodopirellula solitaria]